MSSGMIEAQRAKAEVFHGDATCKAAIQRFLAELSLPPGLLPLDEVVEFGRNRETGFVWATQRKAREHTFRRIGQRVSYAAEVTGFVGARGIERLTGVKTREFFLWLSVTGIRVEECCGDDDDIDGSGGESEITFETGAGLSGTFPAWAFDHDE